MARGGSNLRLRMSEGRERLAASKANLCGGAGQGWWLEVGRARVGSILGDG